MAIHKKTKITIDVNLDENNIPEEMRWTAPDGGVSDMDTKAMLLSFWDSENQETLKMDLWVKEMPVDQMQLFFHQTLVSLSDTFYRATQDEKMTATMKDFCDYFAEKLELKKS
jgi:gliding motility-associated protein GldC